MALCNRVQPDGSIVAEPARGLFMGNRGVLHDDRQRLGTARWRHKAWVTCVLSFKGRHRRVMSPNRYTELFFLDEAVAFAAGHRPCAECRRQDYNRFRRAAGIIGPITQYDRLLHESRIEKGTRQQRRHRCEIGDLPDGVFILWQERSHLVKGNEIVPYWPAGYANALPRPVEGTVTVLTPRLLVMALQGGYRPTLAID